MGGFDDDGITEISTSALIRLWKEGRILEKIEMAKNHGIFTISFIFKDHSFYNATGFGFGYSGEGCHGLYEVIKLFCPDDIEDSFEETPISILDSDKIWNWYPKKGFVSAE